MSTCRWQAWRQNAPADCRQPPPARRAARPVPTCWAHGSKLARSACVQANAQHVTYIVSAHKRFETCNPARTLRHLHTQTVSNRQLSAVLTLCRTSAPPTQHPSAGCAPTPDVPGRPIPGAPGWPGAPGVPTYQNITRCKHTRVRQLRASAGTCFLKCLSRTQPAVFTCT